MVPPERRRGVPFGAQLAPPAEPAPERSASQVLLRCLPLKLVQLNATDVRNLRTIDEPIGPTKWMTPCKHQGGAQGSRPRATCNIKSGRNAHHYLDAISKGYSPI